MSASWSSVSVTQHWTWAFLWLLFSSKKIMRQIVLNHCVDYSTKCFGVDIMLKIWQRNTDNLHIHFIHVPCKKNFIKWSKHHMTMLVTCMPSNLIWKMNIIYGQQIRWDCPGHECWIYGPGKQEARKSAGGATERSGQPQHHAGSTTGNPPAWMVLQSFTVVVVYLSMPKFSFSKHFQKGKSAIYLHLHLVI